MVFPCRGRRSEGGFTLVELMVVVLLLAVLLAFAVPALLGARARAQDRLAQRMVRDAALAELVVLTGRQRFTDDVSELEDVEASLAYTQALGGMTPGGAVYVELPSDPAMPADAVLLGARSASGTCFWILRTAGPTAPAFASNGCGATPPAGDFAADW